MCQLYPWIAMDFSFEAGSLRVLIDTVVISDLCFVKSTTTSRLSRHLREMMGPADMTPLNLRENSASKRSLPFLVCLSGMFQLLESALHTNLESAESMHSTDLHTIYNPFQGSRALDRVLYDTP